MGYWAKLVLPRFRELAPKEKTESYYISTISCICCISSLILGPL